MTRLLMAVLEVHLTNEDSSLLTLATPAAIVLAAIAGAHFAARYAGQNVAKELAAAELRLKQELRHDQKVREKEAARRTLDEVGHGPQPRTKEGLVQAQEVRSKIPDQLNLFLEAARIWMDQVVDPEC